MIPCSDRKLASNFITEAVSKGARMQAACEALGISKRTFERWQVPDGELKKDARLEHGRAPANKLTHEERAQIREIVISKSFRDLPPNQIIPKLTDQGVYVASESTFYRVMHLYRLNTYRSKAKKGTPNKPTPHIATKPNTLWSWDITYLPRDIKGTFFYLYFIMDVFSRKIVGFEIYERECSKYASMVAREAYESEKINGRTVCLHSDNGKPMKGGTMLSMLQLLGITPSFSRPSVSDDNPFSEALFKTLKYCPRYPSKPFSSLESARDWVEEFVAWYNNEHQHSGIKYVTPTARHMGLDKAILKNRELVYALAKAKNPKRWSGKTRNWDYVSTVHLNPNKSNKAKSAA